MRRPFPGAARWIPTRKLVCAAIWFVACSTAVLADTPGLLSKIRVGGCYCHCAESNLSTGCVKMCDSKKYAPRWWAKTCAKPHMQTPANNSNAGPRFPHPGRAEHAQR